MPEPNQEAIVEVLFQARDGSWMAAKKERVMRRIVMVLLLGLSGCGSGVGIAAIGDPCNWLECPESFPPTPE